ncbi:MAG: H/ACA ribonucleoprotein complex subunit GAR1 [Candidatus Baldrarchaeia archaeon]
MIKRLGKVLHVSPHKVMIVRSTFAPAIGNTVVTKDMENIGEVFDVFGPVSKPYVSIKPKKGVDPEKLIGATLYVYLEEEKETSVKKRKPAKRKVKGKPQK